MRRKIVESSHLYSVGYENGVLEIKFQDGGVYRYYNVPYHVYEELMDADSKGNFFHYNIRTQNYQYEKIR
jgi:hypothetical protein